MCDSNAYEHIGAVRRTESVPAGHLIGGTQSVPVPVAVPQDKNGQPAIACAAAVVGSCTSGPYGSGYDPAPERVAALEATDPLDGTAAPPPVVLPITRKTGASMATPPAVETRGRAAGRPALTNSTDAVAAAKLATARGRRGRGRGRRRWRHDAQG